MSEADLKKLAASNCPHCGSSAEVRREMLFSSMAYRYFVACRECGIETPRIYRTADAAVKTWNRRPFSNNADRIRAMNDQELADFLHEVGVAEPPWDKAFSREFCDDCRICENVLGFIDCPHGRPVDWWLEQEVCADA